MLALLDAFSNERHVWTVEAMSVHFGYTPSSVYRYVRELCKAGLLVRIPGGGYVIGARVVELDTLIKETDPLTKLCIPTMTRLAQETGCHALLSNVYGDHLINVAHVPGKEQMDLTFLHGRRLPWFRGAPSKAILAFLPRKRIIKLFNEHFEGDKNKENWRIVLSELKRIEQAGYCISEGALQEDAVGFGAPIIADGEVLGSISLVCSKRHANFLNYAMVGQSLVHGCKDCTTALPSGTAVVEG